MTEVTDEVLRYMDLYAKALQRIAELELEVKLLQEQLEEVSDEDIPQEILT